MNSRNRSIVLVSVAIICSGQLTQTALSGQDRALLAEVKLPTTVRATTPAARFAILEERIADNPGRYDLLWKAAEEGASLGASLLDAAGRKEVIARARGYAELASVAEPDGVDGHYWLAVTSGLLAEEEGGRTKIRLAEQAWDESSWVLLVDADHAGAHHLQGRLHAAVMRLNRVLRFLARSLLGGDALSQASWESAEYHLVRAAELAPGDPVNHLEVGMAYMDLDRLDEARAAFDRAASINPRRAADRKHIAQADRMLARIQK
jgi:tetratricopeptide (TPR) repeat protein